MYIYNTGFASYCVGFRVERTCNMPAGVQNHDDKFGLGLRCWFGV
jgi:hypothetical protein